MSTSDIFRPNYSYRMIFLDIYLFCSSDSMTKKKLANLNVRIPQNLKEILNQHLELTLHVNLSEFTRDALREKLVRDNLQLTERLFEGRK